jgi:hypothetical protein
MMLSQQLRLLIWFKRVAVYRSMVRQSTPLNGARDADPVPSATSVLARCCSRSKAFTATLDAITHETTQPWQGFSLNKN